MSPEQAAGAEELDGRSDQYSLGWVLYEMLAGEPPWTGPTPQAVIARRLLEPPTPIRLLRAAVPAELEAVLARALAPEPADRFPSAGEFARVARPTRPRSTGQRATAAACRRCSCDAAGAAESDARARRPASRSLWAVPPCCGTRAPLRLPSTATSWPWRHSTCLTPTLGLWREGLIDVLARKFDGAGPLRTVSPLVIVRRWQAGVGRPGLGRRTRASYRGQARRLRQRGSVRH